MGVPAKYAEDMFSVPKHKIQWIRNDEFASDFAGFIAALRGLVEARCGNGSDVKNKNECERNLQDELALRGDSLKKQNAEIPQATLDGLGISAPLPK
jgi:hypothetical protein